MKALTTVLFCFALTASAAAPAIDNDNSCDLSLLPAATLLLPYFEVDITSPVGTGETTIFTITNTGQMPQVAHVTLWTDYGYPVIDFNIFLTGYDVQSINLYDVIRRGMIAPDDGTGFDVSPVGELSGNVANQITFDNPILNENSCIDLPVQLPQVYITRMQSAFTTGKIPQAGSTPACNTAGSVHTNAVGYATIDVVGECATVLPTDLDYYGRILRFDNVLGGDYQQINGNEDFAQGNPLVHIRAIPEGGTPTQRAQDPKYKVNFPRTFYSRFQTEAFPVFDGRQPLPATFAARWISGGASGFQTSFKIWREGRSISGTVCSAYPGNAQMGMIELVRFDEEENPETLAPDLIIDPPIANAPALPVTSLVDVRDEAIFPSNSQNAVADQRDPFASQNWVVSSMRAEGRFSTDFDALALGNGCTRPIKSTEATGGTDPIGPAPNTRP